MRMSLAWAKTAVENVSLKWATASLSLICLILVIGILRLSLRSPFIVERGCYSNIVNPTSSNDPTNEEIRSFLLSALSFRFDSFSDAKVREISMDELQFKIKEQELLKQKQIVQKLLISNIAFEGKEIFVDADRVITFGKVKTIIPMPLKVEVQKTSRSEANPFGLILTGTSSAQKEMGK